MKTVELIKCGKGYYVNVRYNGRTVMNEYYKTNKAANERIKVLKGEGYQINK